MNVLFRKTALSLTVASSMALFGCSTSGQVAGGAQADRLADIEQRELALKEYEAKLQAREQALSGGGSLPADAVNSGDLLPPNAAPGECYARVWVDAQYDTREEEVLVSEASKEISIIPAQYETVSETVEVSAASTRLETIPAVYGEEQETVKVRDGMRLWRVGLETNDAPASQALLAAAVQHGIDLDSAPVGACYHEHYVPATYKTVSEQVLVKAATEEVSIVPAEYTMVEETVLVKEASTKLIEVPAQYEFVEEQIVDKPAHTIWKKGTGPIQKIDEATGEIMCLVEVPATYKTVKRKVLASPAKTEVVEIPAEYKTVQVRKLVSAASESRTPIPAVYDAVERQEIDQAAGFVWHEVSNTDHPSETRTGNKICLTETQPQYKTVTRTVVQTPAQTQTIDIPAEYKQVQVTKLVEPAREVVNEIPAEYRTVTRRELVRDGYMAWRSILCETNMTRSRIAQIQQALINAGYNVGANGADGVIGAQTISAVNEFQRANNLPVDKYLNIDTVKALGVSPK